MQQGNGDPASPSRASRSAPGAADGVSALRVTPAIATLTEVDCANRAAERWTEQYRGWEHDTEKAEIGRQLRALTNPNPDVVDAIIGNCSWTRLNCAHCNVQVPAVAVFRAPEDYPLYLCHHCLVSAAQAIEARRAETRSGSVGDESAVPEGDAPEQGVALLSARGEER